MNSRIRNSVAILFGWIGGSFINMGLVSTGHFVFPIEGIDPNDMKALAKIMPTLDFKHFVFPFLAHALGTLIGAIIAARVAATHKMTFALSVGALFLIGGIMVNYMLAGPLWFTISDILLAYIPMGYLGGKISTQVFKK